jgi:hypothetical protein
MKMLSARRRRFEWLNTKSSDRYLQFLKNQVYEVNPRYFSIIKQKPVMTPDGEMVEVKISEQLDDPNCDIIIYAEVNRTPIIIWKDDIFTTAKKYFDSNAFPFCGGLESFTETVIIHKIEDEVKDEDRVLE